MHTSFLALLFSNLSFAAAWPIFFYKGENCKGHPVMTLHFPPPPNVCKHFEEYDIHSYFGGTEDKVQKVLLYNQPNICHRDAAHFAYANHTIGDSTTRCHSFHGYANIPRAFVFIEEILGPAGNAIDPAASDPSSCNALTVQA